MFKKYQRTQTAQAVRITPENIMGLAGLYGGSVTKTGRGLRLFVCGNYFWVGDLVTLGPDEFGAVVPRDLAGEGWEEA